MCFFCVLAARLLCLGSQIHLPIEEGKDVPGRNLSVQSPAHILYLKLHTKYDQMFRDQATAPIGMMTQPTQLDQKIFLLSMGTSGDGQIFMAKCSLEIISQFFWTDGSFFP